MIPHKIRITSKVTVLVKLVEKFDDPNQLGLWTPSRNEITLLKNLNEDDQIWVFFHELIHAISDTHDIGITEKQTEKLEEAMRKVFKLNKLGDGINFIGKGNS